jgi:hypothetical protein
MKVVLSLADFRPPYTARIPAPRRKSLANNPGIDVRGRVDGHSSGIFARNKSGQAFEFSLREVDEAKLAVQGRVREGVAAGGAVNSDRDHDRSVDGRRMLALTTSV